MRASFLLVLALALLVGLGVAVAVKSSGLLAAPPIQQVVVEKKEVVVVPPAPTVLVPTRNMYSGDTVRPGDVRVRPARGEEIKLVEGNRSDYFPATADAAYYRFPTRNIEADTPLKRADLKDIAKPESLNSRLAPGTRAVNLSLAKINAAGGLVQVGDWVDIYVTTEVARTDEGARAPHTGLIARHAEVVAKRDTLWTIFAPLPATAEIQFTLAANPYRAAVIEYARVVGALVIVPVSANEKKILDDRKAAAMADPAKSLLLTVGNPDAAEYKEEERRIAEYERGTQGVGGDELARVLNLAPILPPAPAPAPPPPAPTVELFSGVNKTGTAAFPAPTPAPTPAPKAAGKYVFTAPPVVKPTAPATPAAPTARPVAPASRN